MPVRLSAESGSSRNFMNLVVASSLLLAPTLVPPMDSCPPPSPVEAVVPELAELKKWNDSRGDTWDPFWADDDLLYSFNCDGYGFGPPGQNRNIAFNRFRGTEVRELAGELVNQMDDYGRENETGPDGATWKVCGQECIDGVFYAFVARNVYGHSTKDPWLRQTSRDSSLTKSIDRGRTWERSAHANLAAPMWPGASFGAPGFFHYGRDGGNESRDAADKYVYALTNDGFWNGGDHYRLGRVRRSELPHLRASDWTYFCGGDGSRDTAWSPSPADAVPVLSSDKGCGWTSPTFVRDLQCYLLVGWRIEPPLTQWFDPPRVHYSFFVAPHPWGPWEQRGAMDDSFLGGDHLYGPNAIARFQQPTPEGVKVWIFNSGCPFGSTPISAYKAIAFPVILRSRPLPKFRRIEEDAPQPSRADNVSVLIFAGNAVELVAARTAGSGKITVALDDREERTIDLAQHDFAALQDIVVFRAEALSPGEHRLRVSFSRAADRKRTYFRVARENLP